MSLAYAEWQDVNLVGAINRWASDLSTKGVLVRAEELSSGSDVAETPMSDILEALASKLEDETATSLEGLRQQAVRLRQESAATVASLRHQAARLRDVQNFSS